MKRRFWDTRPARVGDWRWRHAIDNTSKQHTIRKTRFQMIKQTFKMVDKNLTTFLVATPIINVLSIWILTVLHWTIWQGKYGYVISCFFVFLGLTILLSLIILNNQIKFNGRTLLNIIISLALGYLVYVDINFLLEAMSNHGFIPCHLGPSCP